MKSLSIVCLLSIVYTIRASNFVTTCDGYMVCMPGAPALAVYQRDGFSSLALAIDGTPQLYLSPSGSPYIPSCVGWTASGELVAGAEAAALTTSLCNIEALIYSTSDTMHSYSGPYNISQVNGGYVVTVRGVQHDLARLQRVYVSHLKSLAEEYFNTTLTKAVIVNDYIMPPKQRILLASSYSEAELEVSRVFRSQVSIATAYNISNTEEIDYIAVIYGENKVLISHVNVDYGIFEHGEIEELSLHGDVSHLSDEIDARIRSFLHRSNLPPETLILHSSGSYRNKEESSFEKWNLNEAIVLGAAMKAYDMHCYLEMPCLCIEVLQLQVGLRIANPNGTCGVDTLIKRNKIVPTRKAVLLSAQSDEQETMRVEIVQGCAHVLAVIDVPVKGNKTVELIVMVDADEGLHVHVDNLHGVIIDKSVSDGMERSILLHDATLIEDCALADTCEAKTLYPLSIDSDDSEEYVYEYDDSEEAL